MPNGEVTKSSTGNVGADAAPEAVPGVCELLRQAASGKPSDGQGPEPEQARAATDAVLKRHSRRRRTKPSLTRKLHNKLATVAALFAETLMRDPDFAKAINSDLRGFRSDLLRILKRQFPLKRGRPTDPLIDSACQLVNEGTRVPEVLRTQIRDWDKLDKYTRYLAVKGLRQAVTRRSGKAPKKSRNNRPHNSTQPETSLSRC